MNQERILVIDDDPAVADATAILLEMEGYNVSKAYGGVEGLHTATQEQPNLILLDTLMPGMDGYEVLQNIKRRKIRTRVIVLTAYREKEKIVKFMRAGACDYLIKDEAPENMIQAVKRALEIEKTIDQFERDDNHSSAEKTEDSETLKKCFVIMPIGSGEMYEEYLHRYEHIIKPAVEGVKIEGKQVYKSIRADFVSQTGSITRTILDYLYNSDVVIADLSDLNPNVFYELGVRHSLRNKTILIASKGTQPPFDIGDLRITFYENKIGGEKKVIPEIQALLLNFAKNEEQIDSPVFHAIPMLSALQRDEAEKYIIARENEDLKAVLSFVEQFMDVDNWNLPTSFKDEITNIFSVRDAAIVSKNEREFLGTQLENKEIAGGSSKGYLNSSRMNTSILKFAHVNKNLRAQINSDYVVLVREDYERNNKYSHSAYLIYYFVKTKKGIQIVALKSI
jgi:CheY-like chemotaxis protein